jgi:hypothetical protein
VDNGAVRPNCLKLQKSELSGRKSLFVDLDIDDAPGKMSKSAQSSTEEVLMIGILLLQVVLTEQ